MYFWLFVQEQIADLVMSLEKSNGISASRGSGTTANTHSDYLFAICGILRTRLTLYLYNVETENLSYSFFSGGHLFTLHFQAIYGFL